MKRVATVLLSLSLVTFTTGVVLLAAGGVALAVCGSIELFMSLIWALLAWAEWPYTVTWGERDPEEFRTWLRSGGRHYVMPDKYYRQGFR